MTDRATRARRDAIRAEYAAEEAEAVEAEASENKLGGVVHRDAGACGQQFGDGDASLQPGERRAEAVVHAVAERQVRLMVSAADLGTLGGRQSSATAISGRGHVVGASETADGQWHAFLWRAGTMTDLGALPSGDSYATDVNDAGQVVGASTTSPGAGWHPVLWQRGALTDLDPDHLR